MERQAGWVGGWSGVGGGGEDGDAKERCCPQETDFDICGSTSLLYGGVAVQGEEWSRETPRSCGEKGVIILSQSITVTHKHTTTAVYKRMKR